MIVTMEKLEHQLKVQNKIANDAADKWNAISEELRKLQAIRAVLLAQLNATREIEDDATEKIDTIKDIMISLLTRTAQTNANLPSANT